MNQQVLRGKHQPAERQPYGGAFLPPAAFHRLQGTHKKSIGRKVEVKVENEETGSRVASGEREEKGGGPPEAHLVGHLLLFFFSYVCVYF